MSAVVHKKTADNQSDTDTNNIIWVYDKGTGKHLFSTLINKVIWYVANYLIAHRLISLTWGTGLIAFSDALVTTWTIDLNFTFFCSLPTLVLRQIKSSFSRVCIYLLNQIQSHRLLQFSPINQKNICWNCQLSISKRRAQLWSFCSCLYYYIS